MTLFLAKLAMRRFTSARSASVAGRPSGTICGNSSASAGPARSIGQERAGSRHTVASHLVQHGVRMKAVADILGHAELETTAIYAKLDVTTLLTVALPWPGGAQ